MAPPQQKQEHKHPLPLWIRWCIVFIVPLIVVGGTILWIIQGPQAFIPLSLLTGLGILLTFSQVLPLLFPNDQQGRAVSNPPQKMSDSRSVDPTQTPSQSEFSPTGITCPDRVENLQTPAQSMLVLSEQDTTHKLTRRTKVDWLETPYNEQFYGRHKELKLLNQWILDDKCRMIAVLGTGGIGKTSLAVRAMEQVKSRFTYIFWCTLQNTPLFKDVLQHFIQSISDQRQTDPPEDIDDQITLLIQYFQDQPCLFIFDNVDAILQVSNRSGHYRENYEGYGKFFQRVGETRHQSCLLLTSREKPKEVVRLEGVSGPVRSLPLTGLDVLEGQKILKDKGLSSMNDVVADLIHLYSGNPLYLKLVAETIQEVFGGNIASFLKEGKAVFGDIRDPLDLQFARLSALEREIMYWLAIERETVSLGELHEDLALSVSEEDLLVAISALRRRSMIEQSRAASFMLQPVIMEYITDRLIEQMRQEFETETIGVLGSYALIKAQAKDYVRESQIRLILMPIARHLLNLLDKEGLEKKCKGIITKLHEKYDKGYVYAAGNVINILAVLGYDLRGYDFSHLAVRQAYLQGLSLPGVNFAHADLRKCVFTDTFGSALSVTFSQRGDLLAAGTANGEVRLWSIDGTALHTYQGHTDWVRSVAFNPDGTLVVSGSEDQTVRLWATSSGQCLKILQGHSSRIRSVAFSPDGSIVASGSDDHTIRLWEVNSGQCLKILQGHTNWVRWVTFSPDGSMIGSSGEDQAVKLWEVSSGQCLKTLQGHSGWVHSVAFSPDGTLVASGSEDQAVKLWEVSSGQCLKTLQGHTSWVLSVTFSPDGNIVASSSDDQTVRLWEVSSGQYLKMLRGHTNRVRSVVFSPDGAVVASGSDDQTVRLWEASRGQCLKILQGYISRVYSVAFNPLGRTAVSSDDQAVRLWEVKSGQCLKTFQGHSSRIRSVAFSLDGTKLASGGDDQVMRLWEVKSGQCLKTFQGHSSRIWSVVFSPDGSIIASGSDDHTVRLWEVSSGQCLKTLQGHTSRVRSVAFSPDGNIIASGGDDHMVRLWEAKSGQCLQTLQEYPNRVYSVAFSPDGHIVASGGDDQAIRLWEVSSGQCLKTLQGHTSRVRSVVFSLDGTRVVSGSDDHTVRLWEVSSGQCLKTLQEHTNWVRSVAFSPHGNTLASGSDDGTFKLWDVRKNICLKTLKSDRPYEHMNITNVKGLTGAQKETLKLLGAIEDDTQVKR